MKKYLLAIMVLTLGIVLATGCLGNRHQTATPAPSDLKEVVITLERTACHGTCPVYTLTIYGSGTVIYEGKEFVKTTGEKEWNISEEKVRQLVSEFEKIDYFSKSDSYEERTITDAPSVITSITIDGKTKSIKHYHGDFSAPELLTKLENRIDEITNSAQWIE
ncbi:DUF6438 domain-containing protein [Chloroflexota bacterium]